MRLLRAHRISRRAKRVSAPNIWFGAPKPDSELEGMVVVAMGEKYDPKVEKEIRETAEVARETGASYKESERSRNDQREEEHKDAKEKWRDKHGKC